MFTNVVMLPWICSILHIDFHCQWQAQYFSHFKTDWSEFGAERVRVGLFKK